MKDSVRLRKKRCPADGAAREVCKLGGDLEVEAFPELEVASAFGGKPKRVIGHLGGQRSYEGRS